MISIEVAIGIILSIGLFTITYSKTIGARKEREASTYQEIIKILFRNLIRNDYIPSIQELNRICQSKCVDNKIKLSDLPDEIDFISAVYTKLVEDEVLDADRKKSLIEKINNYIEKNTTKVQVKPYEELEGFKRIREVKKEDIRRLYLMLSSSLLATLSVYIALSIQTKLFSYNELRMLLITFIGAMVSLLMITLFIRLKEKEEETTSRTDIQRDQMGFRNSVVSISKDFGELIKGDGKDSKTIFDIAIKRGDKTFLIESKYFRGYVPGSFIARLLNMAKVAKEEDKNNIVILVVNNKKYLYPVLDVLNESWDHVYDINEFSNFRDKVVHKIKVVQNSF